MGTPSPFALYAWAITRTKCSTAILLPPGMDSSKPSPNASEVNYSSAETTNPSVSIGNRSKAVRAGATTNVTSVPDAVNPITELMLVFKHRKLNALTPYNPDAWEHLLTNAGLFSEYQHIPNSLHYGFHIKLPLIGTTQIPPNHPTVVKFEQQFTNIIRDEIQKGRYTSPLSRAGMESLIGPFQSSPFSIIPKPAKPGKYCILQNYSFPLSISISFPNPSINSYINSNDFPTTWGTFSLISLLLRQLPPGSQIATRDVAKAYRMIPLHPSQWPAAVAWLSDDSFAINTSICFGVSPSAGTYREVCKADSDIMRLLRIGPLSGWVDDHFFI